MVPVGGLEPPRREAGDFEKMMPKILMLIQMVRLLESVLCKNFASKYFLVSYYLYDTTN